MAGLIPQSFIDDLLARSDIIDVINKRVSLKSSGKNYTACCPFHQEKTPSFSVQPDKQFYYCFGCGAGGNALMFIMNYEQLDFPRAVEALASENGLEVPREESEQETKRRSDNELLLSELEAANQYFQTQLKQHNSRQKVSSYLKSRGLSGKIAKAFQLGYAPPGWDNLVNQANANASRLRHMLNAGLIIKADGKETSQSAADGTTENLPHYYDRFRDRVIFPIRDSRGRTIAFGGRVMGDDKPKYLNSPETPVFHKSAELYGLYESRQANYGHDANNKSARMLIVEGYMDVIALAQMEICNAVATLGTATNERHLARLFRQVEEVVFCFDGDAAGRTAAWRALQASLSQMEDGRRVSFLFLPEGEDPDSLVRKIGKQAFNEKVDEAMPLEEFFLQKLAQDLDLNKDQDKARLKQLAEPLMKQFPHGLFAQLMLDRLAAKLGKTSESLSGLIEIASADSSNKVMQQNAAEESGNHGDYPIPPEYDSFYYPDPGHSNPRSDGQPPIKGARAGKRQVLGKTAGLKAIELLLQNPQIALTLKEDLTPLKQNPDETRQLLLAMIEMVHRDPNIETYTLVGYCFASDLDKQLLQLLETERITPAAGVEQEFSQIIGNMLTNAKKYIAAEKRRNELESLIKATNKQNE